MAAKPETVLFGIEYAARRICVETSSGHRAVLTGQFDDPEVWLGHVFYGVPVPTSAEVRGVIAMPVSTLRESGPEVAKVARALRFKHMLACSACFALSHGVGETRDRVAIHVTSQVSSVGLMGAGLPGHEEEDYVRPIAGREAREILVSLRCLLNGVSHERRRKLLEDVVVGGDSAAIASIGVEALKRELWALGAEPRIIAGDSETPRGALEIARMLLE